MSHATHGDTASALSVADVACYSRRHGDCFKCGRCRMLLTETRRLL